MQNNVVELMPTNRSEEVTSSALVYVAWLQFCRANSLEQTMSRKGNCRDNAVAESFISGLKKERVNNVLIERET